MSTLNALEADRRRSSQLLNSVNFARFVALMIGPDSREIEIRRLERIGLISQDHSEIEMKWGQ